MNQGNQENETADVVDRNIHMLLKRRKESEEKHTLQQRIVNTIADFAGNMIFIYVHIIILLAWILINKGLTPIEPFDLDFVMLGTVAAVEAIFLATFVLIGQKHSSVEEDKRAELALQISLLTEHEVTRVLLLTTEIAKKMGMEHIINEEIENLSKDTKPEKVLDSMENAKEENSDK